MHTEGTCMLIILTTCFARQPQDLEPQATLSRQDSEVKELLKSGVRRVLTNLHNMYSRPIAREGVNDLPLQIMERRPIPPHNPTDGDCLKSERGNLRPYPNNNNCYSRESTADNKDLWWSLWGEIGGDFRYTFDFVLWDKYFPTRKENQFWYLMLYLKTLAKTIKNHEEIVSIPVYQNEKNKLDKQISVLLDYSKKDEGEKNMMEKLSDISSTMALYQADMRMLDGKLNEVFASVAHVQAHKNMLHNKLSDLDLKTSLIKTLIEKGQSDSGSGKSVFRMPIQDRMPMSGQSGVPMSGQSGLPMSGLSRMPVSGQSAMSMLGQSRLPMSGQSGVPMSGQSRLPMSGQSGVPMSGQSRLPMSGQSGVPMSGQSGVPVSGQSRLPMSGQSGVPKSGQSRLRMNDQPRLAIPAQARMPTVSRMTGMSSKPNSQTSFSQIRSFPEY